MKSSSHPPLAQPALRLLSLFCLTSASLLAPRAPLLADTFGSGADSFSIDFVTIGNPGNPPDTTGQPNPAGSVPYAYRIGKYEISEQMIEKANALGGLGITKDERGPNYPATSLSWFEAAKFVNWLNTSEGQTPAYKFDAAGDFQLWSPSDAGYDPSNLFRNSQATYFLPSADEWYKAAYYDPVADLYYDYATGSNTPPTALASGTLAGTAVYRQLFAIGPADITQGGGLSPYGTMAQEGNVQEFEETELDLNNDSVMALRGRRGGNWDTLSSTTLWSDSRFASAPDIAGAGTGFRIASTVPEPSSQVILGTILFAILIWRRNAVSGV
jgi:hypothetical protein